MPCLLHSCSQKVSAVPVLEVQNLVMESSNDESPEAEMMALMLV